MTTTVEYVLSTIGGDGIVKRRRDYICYVLDNYGRSIVRGNDSIVG
jgi:hypothetical protein